MLPPLVQRPQASSGGGTVITQDEGIDVDLLATTLNFVGSGVTVTGGLGTSTVTVPGNPSPLTTKGDLWGYSTVDVRVPIGADGKFLKADSGAATGVSWGTVSASPGGADTQVQFNDGGAFGADADFTWNKTSNVLTVTGQVLSSTLGVNRTPALGGKIEVVGRSYFIAASEPYSIGAMYATTSGQVYFGAASNVASPDAVISNNAGSTLVKFLNAGGMELPTASTAINFSSTGQFITGDMSNATHSNRLAIRTNTVNGATRIGVIPNGTGTAASISCYSNSDRTAALNLFQLQQAASITLLDCSVLNGGTQGTFSLRIGNSEALGVDATKNVQLTAGFQRAVVVKTANYTIVETDSIVIADCTTGNVTLTLPAANIAGAGFSASFRIKRLDSSANTVTIARAGADTIDGGTTYALGAKQAADLESDGVSAWYAL